MISIVLPLYNKEKYIVATLNSILKQSYQFFEVIVVNDGSKDKGRELVEGIIDERIKLINKPNGGVSSARNVGIQMSKYDYIAFLDADDEWLPNHLEEIYGLIEEYKNQADVFVTNFARKFPNGIIKSNRIDLKRGVISNYFKSALHKSVIHTSSVCVTKRALLETNGFNENLSRGEDIDLWARLAKKYQLVYSSSITEHYLIEAENNSGKKIPIEKSFAYYVNCSSIKNDDELKYFRKMLFTKFFLILLKERDFKNLYKFMAKQLKNYFS